MLNWFDRNYDLKNEVRYQASVPIDIWVENTNNPEAEQEKAYNLIKSAINEGFKKAVPKGYRENLQLSHVQKYE